MWPVSERVARLRAAAGPSGPTLHARASTRGPCGPGTRVSAGPAAACGSPLSQRSPLLRVAPSSSPRRRPQPHVTPAPLFLRGRLARTRLGLRARGLSPPVSLPLCALLPRFSFRVMAVPFPPHRDTPFLRSAWFFVFCFFSWPPPGVLPSAPGASLSGLRPGLPAPRALPGDPRSSRTEAPGGC